VTVDEAAESRRREGAFPAASASARGGGKLPALGWKSRVNLGASQWARGVQVSRIDNQGLPGTLAAKESKLMVVR